MFKKKKKYKITFTEDEIFILSPIILIWIEDWEKEQKEEEKKENYNDRTKEIYKWHIKNGFSILNKIKEVNGHNKYWKKFWKKYKKEKK